MAAAGVAAGAALGLLLGLRWLARGRGVAPGPRVAMYGAGGEAVCSRRAALLASGVSGAGLLVAPAAFARLPVPPEGYIRCPGPSPGLNGDTKNPIAVWGLAPLAPMNVGGHTPLPAFPISLVQEEIFSCPQINFLLRGAWTGRWIGPTSEGGGGVQCVSLQGLCP